MTLMCLFLLSSYFLFFSMLYFGQTFDLSEAILCFIRWNGSSHLAGDMGSWGRENSESIFKDRKRGWGAFWGFGIFCQNRCDCIPGSYRGGPRCAPVHLLPFTSSRQLPWQLSCVIETFQHEICFFSLNFKQNFKCQVSEAKWGY